METTPEKAPNQVRIVELSRDGLAAIPEGMAALGINLDRSAQAEAVKRCTLGNCAFGNKRADRYSLTEVTTFVLYENRLRPAKYGPTDRFFQAYERGEPICFVTGFLTVDVAATMALLTDAAAGIPRGGDEMTARIKGILPNEGTEIAALQQMIDARDTSPASNPMQIVYAFSEWLREGMPPSLPAPGDGPEPAFRQALRAAHAHARSLAAPLIALPEHLRRTELVFVLQDDEQREAFTMDELDAMRNDPAHDVVDDRFVVSLHADRIKGSPFDRPGWTVDPQERGRGWTPWTGSPPAEAWRQMEFGGLYVTPSEACNTLRWATAWRELRIRLPGTEIVIAIRTEIRPET